MAAELFQLFGKIAVDNNEANSKIDETTGKASSAGETFKKGITTVAKWGAAIGTAAVAAGTAMINTASNFDDSFAQVNTLLKGSEDEISAYKDAIIQASSESGVATDEYCTAIYNAISAGQDQADAIAFTNEALKLAKGGFTDASTAVDVLTTALNAYGLESDQVSSISDMLVTTQNLGKTTVDELASSMGKIIPTANAYGVQIDDLCGMYATMTSNGIATAESTTYMNGMLNELGKSGTTSDKILRELTADVKEGGLGFADMMAGGYELSDVLSLLDGYATKTGVSMMDLFGSAEAGKAAQVLLSNSDQLNSSIAAMADSAGTTQAAYETMTDTLSYKTELLKTNFQNIVTQVGEKLMPVAMKLMDYVMEKMPNIQSLIDKLVPVLTGMFESLLPQFLDLADQILPVLFKTISDLIPYISDIIQTLLPVFVSLITELAPIFTDIIASALPILLSIIKEIIPIIQMLLPYISQIVETILPVLMEILSAVYPIIESLLPVILEIASTVLPIFVDMLQQFLPMILQIVELVLPILVDMFQQFLPLIVEIVNLVLPYMLQLFTEIMPILIEVIEQIMPYAVELFDKFMPVLFQIVESILPVVFQLLDMILPLLSPILELLTPMLDLVMEFLSPLIDLTSKLLPPLVDFIGNTLTAAFNALKPTVEKTVTVFKHLLTSVRSTFSSLKTEVKTPINAILGFINGMSKGVAGGLNNLINAVNAIQINVPDWVTKLTGLSTFGFSIPLITVPDIPQLAEGGDIDRQGHAVVGEAGAELIDLPRGAKVTPLTRGQGESTLDEIKQKLDEMIDAIRALAAPQFGVYMDGDVLVGQIAPAMDAALGNITVGRNRGR